MSKPKEVVRIIVKSQEKLHAYGKASSAKRMRDMGASRLIMKMYGEQNND